jgi:hypothetical protein
MIGINRTSCFQPEPGTGEGEDGARQVGSPWFSPDEFERALDLSWNDAVGPEWGHV